ncbi:fasciclin domain-containing protein [Phormidium tenue FACHB-886]|nr:fasciclin domain-containing protein [Phormidium tenue FACHB-886]
MSNLLQQVSQTGSFTTLAQAVQAAGLDTALQNQGGRYTIFAPTDEAFAALPPGTLEQLLQPANRDLLRQLLSYHVVSGEVRSNQLRTGLVDTLGGGIAVRVTPERVIVNDGSVVQADIPAANGVVHVVNRVLIPRELRQQLSNLQSPQ